MKFRGRMFDSQCMREFSNTINTLSKLGKHGAISLTPTVLSFVIFDDCTPRRILAQCILDQKFFFNEYTVVGVSEEHNQICLQFYPDLLAKAVSVLKYPQSSKSFKIKLAKKNKPCLVCEIEIPTHFKHSRICTHDIPVEIISRKNWPDFQLPTFPQFDISIEIPVLKRFKNICEKMKFLSSQLILEATPKGILALKVETDLASVATYFTNLKVDAYNGDFEEEKCYDVTVDFKKIIGFLTIDQVNPNSVMCNIVKNKMVLMNVVHDNVTLSYLIPGINSNKV
ncbi:Checkpoint protein HUS1, putative [Pediculus humanus corporis]|uniref:Checkpoint protein n=1 Tax=Pediculus humanus subsp. corporis TaxID=121224 RepID=E0VVP0_PEDHC|nr:Checkpoint protein HUS1, putative [Pediculus humanus corporis]EEB17446.1 Checkpoint protein HUS1, putative [Pediculus humanus corporis]